MNPAKRIVLIVQMRLDSTRLPGKALLPLAGGCMAQAVMRRLSSVRADRRVLATDADGAAALGAMAASQGFAVFEGPKDDVLRRFALAASRHEAAYVVRATGDNPLVSYELANALVEHGMQTGADYAGYTGMPTGMGVEFIRAEALLTADEEADSAYDREHVCPYLYTHPERFSVFRPPCPDAWRLPAASVTVDTALDYQRVTRIFDELGRDPSDARLMDWLRAEAGS